MVVADRSPHRLAHLCVQADKALYHSHRRLLRSRLHERRLRLETCFLKYKLALIRKQRRETGAKLGKEIKAKKEKKISTRPSKAQSTHIAYILPDSGSEDEADLYGVLTKAQKTELGPVAEHEDPPQAPGTRIFSVPKRPTNGYLIFCAQMRPMILKLVCKGESLKQQEMQRVLSQVWKEMPTNLKKHYFFFLYEKDKTRYKQQMKTYQSRKEAAEKGNTSVVDLSFEMPNYVLEIPRFLLKLVGEALERDTETGLIDIDRVGINNFETSLSSEEMENIPAHELPVGMITEKDG